MNENEECSSTQTIVPDPGLFNLTNDYIFVEKEWGSLFYKHIGKHNKQEAERLCSEEGSMVHLPIPRFADENKFYHEVFGDEGLWLGVSYKREGQGLKKKLGYSCQVRSFEENFLVNGEQFDF